MKNIFYTFILGFILLTLEPTIFRSFFGSLFNFLGFASLSSILFDTAFILCIYAALTKNFYVALLSAFLLGYLKDIFVLTNAWINPFLFLICALISNIIKRVVMIKGSFAFGAYMFGISIFYTVLWVILTSNLMSNEDAFGIGLRNFLPYSFNNFVFSFLFYQLFKRLDILLEGEEGKDVNYLLPRW